MAFLKILSGEHPGQRVALDRNEVMIGRHPGCDIRVPDETVSRHHARIVVQPGGYFVEDLRSRNGTFLNGRRVTIPSRLCHLDKIHIFNTTVEFIDDGRDALVDEPRSRTSPAETVRRRDPQALDLFETIAEIDLKGPARPASRIETDVKLQAVLEITRYLRSSLEPEEVLARIVECVTHVFPHFSRSYLLRHDPIGDQLVPVVVKEPEDEAGGPPTLRPIMLALARQVLKEGKAVLSADASNCHANGDGISVLDDHTRSLMCAPLVGPTLKPAGVLYIETLDDRKRFSPDDLEVFACVAILAGQALEQATWFGARYRAVVDNAVDGIITINDEGTIESVNPAVARLFGYSENELIGRDFGVLVPDRATEITDSQIAEVLRGDGAAPADVGHEVTARRKDGTTFPSYLSIGRFELSGRQYYTGIVHDTSERHRAEAALRRVNETLEHEVRERTEYIRLLQDVAVIANASESVGQAFRLALERVLGFKPWDVAHVVLRSRTHPDTFVDGGIWAAERSGRYRKLMAACGKAAFRAGQGPIGRAIETALPDWVVDLSLDPSSPLADHAASSGLKSVVACPVLIGSEVAAVIQFLSAESAPPDEMFLDVMRHVGTQLGRVIERDRLQRQLVDAVWNQHRRLGQELHDTLGQALTGIGMLADSLAKRLAARGDPETEKLAEVVGMIQQAKSEVRQLSKGLYPVDVDAQGLLSALEELAASTQQRSQIRCVFKGDRSVQIRDNEVATHLFRIAQEAVHNAVKHSHTRKIVIALSKPRGRLTLAVRDDGLGISAKPSNRSGGLGMRIMHYRATAIGAELSVESAGRGGTQIRCTLKREEHHAPVHR